MKNRTKTDPLRPSEPEVVERPPVPDADPRPLLERLRAAATLEEALSILQPDARRRPRPDAMYEVVEGHSDPLPQKRGTAVKAYAVAVRLNRPFRIADVEAELPDTKAVGFWIRKLATLGFLRQAAS